MTLAPPGTWLRYTLSNPRFPARLVNQGFTGAIGGFGVILPTSIVFEALNEAAFARSQSSPTSPNDVLPYLGQEAGLFQYSSETPQRFSLRLQDKWNIWRRSGDPRLILDQITWMMAPFAQFVSVTIDYDLPGGGNYLSDITGLPDGSNINAYPASTIYGSQFLINIVLSAPIGSGAEGRGLLVNDAQIADLRGIVASFQDMQWVLREIIIQLSPTSERYDQGLLFDNGLTWDPVTENYAERYHR